MQLICARKCGFRVPEDYFVLKPRFQSGVCPRCSGPVDIVEDFTDNVVEGARLDNDRRSGRYGRVVPVVPLEA